MLYTNIQKCLINYKVESISVERILWFIESISVNDDLSISLFRIFELKEFTRVFSLFSVFELKEKSPSFFALFKPVDNIINNRRNINIFVIINNK